MDHRNPETYRFDHYLAARGENWFAENALLTKWVERSRPDDESLDRLNTLGRKVIGEYSAAADESERPENLPYIRAKRPFNVEHGEVVLPASTKQVLSEVHGSGIWKAATDDRVRYAMIYLLSLNGEAGVLCSAACTDGMARILRAYPDDARTQRVITLLENATPEYWIHGAQFVTEIQGGSDAATNAVRAEAIEDGLYTLHGQKWFCSNLTADYWMVTARIPDAPDDHRGVGLFCVPRLWNDQPNGYVIERLKDKLGTRALPTAEMQLVGARGWPIGPLDAGLKNMVAIVLTTSRIYNTIAAAAATRRAQIEASAYASFRHAFGKSLDEHPLLADSLHRLKEAADLADAGALAVVDQWTDALAHPDDQQKKLWTRFLISIAKATATRAANTRIYEAMMVLGGNGIEERFCVLPRLWRDAAIMETWEGSYTLLLAQTLGDMQKYGIAGKEQEFLRYGLGEDLDPDHAKQLTEILKAPTDAQHVLQWGALAPQIYQSFEKRSLAALE